MIKLLEAARVAELTNPTTSDTTGNTVSSQLTEVWNEMKKISARWENLTVNVTQFPSDENSQIHSPKIQRTFKEPLIAQSSQPRPGYADRQSAKTRSFRGLSPIRSPRQQWSMPQETYQQSTSMERRPPPPFQSLGPRRTQWFNVRGNNYLSDAPTQAAASASQRPKCMKCGRRAPQYCPAANKYCNGCGKAGHFARVCRSAARSRQGYYGQ